MKIMRYDELNESSIQDLKIGNLDDEIIDMAIKLYNKFGAAQVNNFPFLQNNIIDLEKIKNDVISKFQLV